MLFSNRGPRALDAPRRKSEAFQPKAESLEEKLLLTLVDLGGGNPTIITSVTAAVPAGTLPRIADFSQTGSSQGIGILQTGADLAQGGGFSVAALGDVNADNNTDYLIGAPTVTTSSNNVILSTANNSRAFLLFGNRSANVPAIQSWLSSTSEQRVGQLSGLGNTLQFDPFTSRSNPLAYAFDGITFSTSQFQNSQLGAAVAKVGSNAFLIGAPNYGPGGRFYLVSGNFGTLSQKSVDLDFPANYPSLTITTFSAPAGYSIGRSFAYLTNFFGDGNANLAIGAPGAFGGAGGVFVTDGIPNTTNTIPIDVSTIGQGTGPSGILFQGVNAGDQAGFSVSTAGNFDGDITGGGAVQDLVIGAPGANSSAGRVYLVFGAGNLGSLVLTSGGVSRISLGWLNLLNPVAGTSNTVPGYVFAGTATERAGYSVATAGDFNLDGFSDFMIGAPGFSGNTGRVPLIYGSATRITPTAAQPASEANPISLGGIPSTIKNVIFVGPGGGSLAGISISGVGPFSLLQSNPILIGTPGLNSGQGAAYLLKAGVTNGVTVTPQGSITLSSTTGYVFQLTTPTGVIVGPNNMGAGVSGDPFSVGGDFILGSPGYNGSLSKTVSNLFGGSPVVLASLLTSVVGNIPTLGGTTGGGGGGGGGTGGSSAANLGVGLPIGLIQPTVFNPPFGSSFVPSVATLSRLDYAPIPLNVALDQFLPPQGFRQRIRLYHNPSANPGVSRGQNASRFNNQGSGVNTLGRSVFTRGRFHHGETYTWSHKSLHNSKQVGRVIPANLSIQKYTDRGSNLR